MAQKVIRTVSAYHDLQNIVDFISEDSMYYAMAFYNDVMPAVSGQPTSLISGQISNMLQTLVSSEQSLNGKLFVEQGVGLFKTYTMQGVLDKLDVINAKGIRRNSRVRQASPTHLLETIKGETGTSHLVGI